MKKGKFAGLAAVLLLVFAMVLSSCGAEPEEESVPEAPPVDTADELYYGYSIGVPEYYSDNGFVFDKKSKQNSRFSEIADQAVLRIIRKNIEYGADEFNETAMEEFGDMTGLGTAELTIEDAEIGGLPAKRISGTDPDGNEMRAALLFNDIYKTLLAVTVTEYNNEAEKEHAYIDDFELIPGAIKPIGPEEYMARLGYTIDFPEYYEKFVTFDMGEESGYVCYSGGANLDMTITRDAGEDSLDRSDAGLEESLRFDDQTGVDISKSDEVSKGPARIRQYSYSFSGMDAGGEGAYIYDTEKDILININLMTSGLEEEDFRGDFRKMIEDLGVEE